MEYRRDEVLKSSTWRELSAVHRVCILLQSRCVKVKVKWYSDNAAVCSIVSKGSMESELPRIALDIFFFLHTIFNSLGARMVTTGIE